MDYQKGMIVRSAAGRDKGGFFVVLDFDDNYAIICDGKRRSLEKTKRKKWKHLCVTKAVLQGYSTATNKEIRRVLANFQSKG